MDHQELRILRILEEIEKNETPSQRDLSRKLNISLGLVNSFVKRLAQKGYFKISTIPKNRVRYLLTPKGATEKTRLTYEYIRSSITFFNNARHKIEKILFALNDDGVRNIIFYGISELAEISFLLMQDTAVRLVGIIDDQQKGRVFLKKHVCGIEDLKSIAHDKILITNIIDPLAAYQNLISAGALPSKIVMI